MELGLTLPNRGVMFGAVTPRQLLDLGEAADRSGAFRSVWVGDSLLAKPRLESIALLSALAGRTERVVLGVACMASFPLRDPVLLAIQWASLDQLASGRTVLVVCTGLVGQAGGAVEASQYGVSRGDRIGRMVEGIEVIKRLWTEERVTFHGRHLQLDDVSAEPKPAQRPRPPIWIANNATRDRATVERTHQRLVEHADGWQTAIWDVEDLPWRVADVRERLRAAARDPSSFFMQHYHNVVIGKDRNAALEEAKRFLDLYYERDHDPAFVEGWTAAGTAKDCARQLLAYRDLGFNETTVRIVSWDQDGQLRRLIEEVAPLVREAAVIGP